MEEFSFFGEVDMKRDGNPSSQYPSWYFDIYLEELKESVSKKKRRIAMGLVAPSKIMSIKNEVEREEQRIKEIEASKPKLRGKLKDEVAKVYQSLEKQLAEEMPTRKEDKDGLVSPHGELKRWDTPHIKVDPVIANACGISMQKLKEQKGKVTGKQAAKMYQIIGKSLGENTNVERIRRDRGVEAYKTMDTMTAKILERLVEGAKRA